MSRFFISESPGKPMGMYDPSNLKLCGFVDDFLSWDQKLKTVAVYHKLASSWLLTSWSKSDTPGTRHTGPGSQREAERLLQEVQIKEGSSWINKCCPVLWKGYVEIQVLGIKRKITLCLCADSCVAVGMTWASNIENPKVDTSVVSRGKQR